MTRILFVPVSGGAGSGEVQRCRLLADALAAAHPVLEPGFLLAEGTAALPWPTTTLPASPTRAVAEVVAAIEAQRPRMVVFDGNTRVKALDAARRVGAKVVLVSSRPSARDRGFRSRRMARLDAHWLVGAELLGAGGWRERFARWRFPHVDVRRFATFFAAPRDPLDLQSRWGITRPYVVACHGGGRHRIDGRDAARLFGDAAARIAATGLATVAVGADGAAPALAIDALPNAELMALLQGADAALLAGGSLLVQALALGTPVVALPMQDEQASRVRWLADAGAVRPASGADPTLLADALRALTDDVGAREALRAGSARLGLRNGLPDAVDTLATLAAD